MKTPNTYELPLWQDDITCIGIDEAGRGPLAGPLVVAGVIFPAHYESDDLYDSKKMSEKKREEWFERIKKEALYYDVRIVSVEDIDAYNIYRATQMTMESIAHDAPTNHVLTDAMPLPASSKEVTPIIKGDQISCSIAAGSILAKVTRDHIMYELDKKYPEYGFAKHKGYPTKQHLLALETYGVLPEHRKSYGPVAKLNQLSFTFEND